MLFIGPISSIFDYATFATMLCVFHAWRNPALFQTGWFVESLLTQTLIIHIIRTAKIPFFQSRATTAADRHDPDHLRGRRSPCRSLRWARRLGFVPLPPLYWPIIAGFLAAYAILAHLVKSWFIKRWGY